MTLKVHSRWTAFAIHLALSILILSGLLVVIFFIWFPRDLIFAGGIAGLKILTAVDLILGPLLTLIVYKQGKPELFRDLCIIGMLQVSSLLAGLWLIYQERPLAQVLADDGIHLLTASDFKEFGMSPPSAPKFADKTPKFILLDLPQDRDELGTIKFTTEFVDEKPFVFRDDLYLPMASQEKQTFDSRVTFIQELIDNEAKMKLAKFDLTSCDWLPLVSQHNHGYACVNFEKGIIRLSEREL